LVNHAAGSKQSARNRLDDDSGAESILPTQTPFDSRSCPSKAPGPEIWWGTNPESLADADSVAICSA